LTVKLATVIDSTQAKTFKEKTGILRSLELMSKFRKDISTNGDAMMVLAIGLVVFVLCALLLVTSEATLLILFLIGGGFILTPVYIAMVCYLFVRMLLRRDTWLFYFLCMSMTFVAFLFWILTSGVVSIHELSRLLIFGGFPYSIFSTALGIVMARGAL
jgi:hypothetical protein